MNVDAFLAQRAERTERALADYVDAWQGVPDALREAMRYSLFAGGKRFRPALALGAAEIVSGNDDVALPAACAVEMIHTYSLIHDDLPAMDNDDLRRGKPTLHKVYGEALAILAGDALLTMAFDMLTRTKDLRVIQEVAQAAGAAGMAGGQVLDLESEGREISLDELRRLHECKTGALIRVSVRSGAMLAGAREDQLAALTRFGEHLGLAFQIADDILDVVGTEAALGKPIGSDANKHKSTYPALVGLARARDLADEAMRSALDTLNAFGPEADDFRALARFVVERQR
jgi:geranylgeranyl diphosphate synthase type II